MENALDRKTRYRKIAGYLAGLLYIFLSLWVSKNAILQTPRVIPGETWPQAVRWLLFGRPVPGSAPCSEAVHARYITQGPDGKQYPTWHPPIDPQTGCYFDHEHGSDPHSYIGFAQSGMPAFGFSAAQAGVQEPHAGYKVSITNDDLHGHAWMITINQDTSTPQRAWEQFHTVDWNLSDLLGNKLVDLHLLGNFGYAHPNCDYQSDLPGSASENQTNSPSGSRAIPTTACIYKSPYEAWTAAISVGDVFEANPLFDIQNPQTVVDPDNPTLVQPTCAFLTPSARCTATSPGNWLGTMRGVTHPGQYVHNNGPENFYTDVYGQRVEAGSPGAILQFVTQKGWDTRDCCGEDVVFRIQTYSEGVYIAAPDMPPGTAEFSVGPR